jgi:hypothetical protein
LASTVSEVDVGRERLPGGVLTPAPHFDGQLYAQEPDLRLIRDSESRRTVVSTPARRKPQSVRGNRIHERLGTAALGTFQIVAAEIIAYDFGAVDTAVSPDLVAERDAGCRRYSWPCGIRGIQKQVSPGGSEVRSYGYAALISRSILPRASLAFPTASSLSPP